MRRVPKQRKKAKAKSPPRARPRATATLHHRDTARFRKLNALLSKRLRALRHARGITIEQASEAAGVEPMTWYRLENQRANPTLAVLASLAAAFGLTVPQLLEDW